MNKLAHTKATGSTQLGRDSQPKYLGVKLYDGQIVKPGNIIVRQRGTKFIPGQGVRLGRDHTIYAVMAGKVKFTSKKRKLFNGQRRLAKVINVVTGH